jgi:hypothetical protein
MNALAKRFWAVVEIMGHQTYAGELSEETIGGTSFVRVDIPATSSSAAFSKLFGSAAIYAITPVAEDVARMRAEKIAAIPLTAWDLPEAIRNKLRSSVDALPGPTERDDMFDDEPDSVSDSWVSDE